MVRQPLLRIGSPLAWCAYHHVAAPYRASFMSQLERSGRGAAGRPSTKQAFIYALGVICGEARQAMLLHALGDVIAGAYEAFLADAYYVTAMASAAVDIMSRQHALAQRQALKDAQASAMRQCGEAAGQFTCAEPGPCGTGGCRFASLLVQVQVPPRPGRIQRPANHVSRRGYSAEPALAALAEQQPFRVA
jgi:hypothetical protein